ncbi:uncharacterized protein LOC100497651 isoform X6 [Xenopus tropicalis]|uniref:Uncharacterized protein LOC100497651 isoform X6 n=1 Tax=Xenopus tropicalis TaxID=8364 RepID=A0A8J1IMY4_XENTR|nr:uncharacterized protein LOC100497651 isoform X6 [Xenopus tropicalis]
MFRMCVGIGKDWQFLEANKGADFLIHGPTESPRTDWQYLEANKGADFLIHGPTESPRTDWQYLEANKGADFLIHGPTESPRTDWQYLEANKGADFLIHGPTESPRTDWQYLEANKGADFLIHGPTESPRTDWQYLEANKGADFLIHGPTESPRTDWQFLEANKERSESTTTPTVGFQLFTLVIWTALSVAMIILGSMHVGNCPREPNIPIYLIVAGAFHLVGFCLIPLKKAAKKVTYALESIIGLFSFCWFIAGNYHGVSSLSPFCTRASREIMITNVKHLKTFSCSVWVFRIYPDDPRACNDLVYKSAFGILIFEYLFIGLVLFSVCLCTCCAGCLAFSGAERNDSQIPS